MRFRVQPRDVPPRIAARRLGMSLNQFKAALPSLIARGFPKADPDSGNIDLNAIDRWCDARHPHLFGSVSVFEAQDASVVAAERIAAIRRGAG